MGGIFHSTEGWDIDVHVPMELISGMVKSLWKITMSALKVTDFSIDIITL